LQAYFKAGALSNAKHGVEGFLGFAAEYSVLLGNAGMTYWAVSDLEKSELQNFVQPAQS
jgi:hypothetical protein